MKTGNLHRNWSAVQPQTYEKERRIVNLDIRRDTQMVDDGEGGMVEQEGYSFLPVQIDPLIDYGHIKSQLIEAGFAQKDEFGLLMNALGDVLEAAREATTWEEFKAGISTEDIEAFRDFTEFRAMCAAAAHEVLLAY